MQMLYDSDTFVVVHLVAEPDQAPAGATPEMVRHGFEIVDKRRGREVFLDGSWAELFEQRLKSWQDKAPTQEEIEATLEGYAQLAHTRIALH